jgi:hypothetical protein
MPTPRPLRAGRAGSAQDSGRDPKTWGRRAGSASSDEGGAREPRDAGDPAPLLKTSGRAPASLPCSLTARPLRPGSAPGGSARPSSASRPKGLPCHRILALLARLPRDRRADAVLRRIAREIGATAWCDRRRCLRSRRCRGPWEPSAHDKGVALPTCHLEGRCRSRRPLVPGPVAVRARRHDGGCLHRGCERAARREGPVPGGSAESRSRRQACHPPCHALYARASHTRSWPHDSMRHPRCRRRSRRIASAAA